jgi:hypothetical protein
MKISSKTIDYLKNIITGDSKKTRYLSGPQLVEFFNELGWQDIYGQGFPSRWEYTKRKLFELNQLDRIEKIIEHYYSPINFIEDKEGYKYLIKELNEYLAFEDLELKVETKTVKLQPKINVGEGADSTKFKDADWGDDYTKQISTSLDQLNIDPKLIKIIKYRLIEIQKGIENNCPLSVIILVGSILEAVFFDLAHKNIPLFNGAHASPKVKFFREWTLGNYIDVAKELGYIKEDQKKFSMILRDFRNYIHPSKQLKEDFHPSIDTAKQCIYVLKGAINQIIEKTEYEKEK